MNRFVPHQELYNQARKWDKALSKVMFVSAGLTIASIIIDKVPQLKGWEYKETALLLINVLSSLLVLAYFALDISISMKIYRAGTVKRADIIDHAFDTSYTGEKSVGYFNPGTTPDGVYKLGVLGFENSLFTSEIAKKMITPKIIFTAIISTIFFSSAGFGNKDFVNNIIQLAATGILIEQAIKQYQYSTRMDRIHDDFKKLFSDLKNIPDKSVKEPEIIRNILNYEATHSFDGILLDSDIFKELNPEVSKKWEALKKEYNII